MSNILPHTGLAACNFNEHIHIYFQGYDGQLLETYTDDGVNFKCSSNPLPAPATPMTFTPLAATYYNDGAEIRVYYLSTDFYLQELCWDAECKDWYAGALNDLKVKTASYSNLAVVHWDEKFRLYYQNSNNEIRELANDGPGWVAGARRATGLPGTKLAAIRTPDAYLRVYYQNQGFQTRQVTSRNEWDDDTEIAVACTLPHCGFAVVNLGTEIINFRMYVGKGGEASNKFCQTDTATCEASDWRGGEIAGDNLPMGNIAAISWGYLSGLRIYRQVAGNDIVEQRWDDQLGYIPGYPIPTTS